MHSFFPQITETAFIEYAYYNFINCILKKTAMKFINILNIKYIHLIYFYDKLFIAHHISSSNLPQSDLASNRQSCWSRSPVLILLNCQHPRLSIQNVPTDRR